jgi:hypothetical protein
MSAAPSEDKTNPPRERTGPRRSKRRLWVLLAVNALALGLYVFARLDRPAAERFGPLGTTVYELFNPDQRNTRRLSTIARRFETDVRALGGIPQVTVTTTRPGFLGVFGRSESFSVRFRGPRIDDKALGLIADLYGDRINRCELANTAVTEVGLWHLKKMTRLRHLHIRNYGPRARRGDPVPPPTITDAGMVHLKELTQLWTLILDGVPITDAGLEAIEDLPALKSLYLHRTKVQGTGLAQLKSFSQLSVLYLDQSAMTEDGLRTLAGATSLEVLSLNGVPLTAETLPLLKAIPRLRRLEITGCGLLDEEVDDLVKSRPGLRVVRP